MASAATDIFLFWVILSNHAKFHDDKSWCFFTMAGRKKRIIIIIIIIINRRNTRRSSHEMGKTLIIFKYQSA